MAISLVRYLPCGDVALARCDPVSVTTLLAVLSSTMDKGHALFQGKLVSTRNTQRNGKLLRRVEERTVRRVVQNTT